MEQKELEISLGAFDSELGGWEYTIPEGFEAEIKNGKIVIRKIKNKDEEIKKAIIKYVSACEWRKVYGVLRDDILNWLEKQGKQKSEWSKEEKSSLMKKCVHKAYQRGYDTGFLMATTELEHKQEWNVEDEQYLLICKNALAKYQVSDKWDAGIISRWLESKLKSLRPQSHWKPSDEQIKGIECAIKTLQHQLNVGDTRLNSLYDDLKKLREE